MRMVAGDNAASRLALLKRAAVGIPRQAGHHLQPQLQTGLLNQGGGAAGILGRMSPPVLDEHPVVHALRPQLDGSDAACRFKYCHRIPVHRVRASGEADAIKLALGGHKPPAASSRASGSLAGRQR